MMQLEKTYDLCIIRGFILEQEPELEEIKSKLLVIQNKLELLKKEKVNKNNVQETFQKHSEILFELVELFLKSKGIMADGEECRNAYLCVKFPSLEINWEFLESTRIKKESEKIEIKYEEWNMLKINFYININIILGELKKI